jgi:hypothetical protein
MIDNKERMRVAREGKKPKLIYKNELYRIYTIKLNYMVIIGRRCKLKHPMRQIDRDFYMALDTPLAEVKKEARSTIAQYFNVSPTGL